MLSTDLLLAVNSTTSDESMLNSTLKASINFKKTVRSLGWCFTLHNYTEEHESDLKLLKSSFLIYGKELTASGVPHLQGYIHFASPGKTAYALRKLISSASWFASKGSIDSNIAYCSKMGNYYHQGNI